MEARHRADGGAGRLGISPDRAHQIIVSLAPLRLQLPVIVERHSADDFAVDVFELHPKHARRVPVAHRTVSPTLGIEALFARNPTVGVKFLTDRVVLAPWKLDQDTGNRANRCNGTNAQQTPHGVLLMYAISHFTRNRLSRLIRSPSQGNLSVGPRVSIFQ